MNSTQKEAVLLTRHLAKLVMQLTGAADDELQEFDDYTETVEVITQVRQAFINLDDAHMGDMDFEKYVQAFQFLHVNASQDEMRKSFDKIDTNNSGFIDEYELLASMVPDVSIGDYTLRNQLMVLESKLEALVSELESLQGIIDDATKENVDADRRVRFLKERLAVLQRETGLSIESVGQRISDLAGKSEPIVTQHKMTSHNYSSFSSGHFFHQDHKFSNTSKISMIS